MTSNLVVRIDNVPHTLIDMDECSEMWEQGLIMKDSPYEQVAANGIRYARYVAHDGTRYASPVMQMHSM